MPKERTSRAVGVGRLFWPAFATPATVWLIGFFVVPFYVIMAVAFGTLDPIFLRPQPVYNPLNWDFAPFRQVLGYLLDSQSIYHQAFVRTLVYVTIATIACLVIGYPVAYFIARHAGRFKTAFLVAFILPFWMSYMMRMFSWINLLQEDGYVNRILMSLGIIHTPELWLQGKPATVVMGLVYGYVPFMVLPLYGTLDRIGQFTIEAARDLGAGQVQTFRKVTLPLSRNAILAGVIIVTLPMFGDYYTQTLLASTRRTSMFGNLIVSSIDSSLVNVGASLVIVMLVLLTIPMIYYLRSTVRAKELAE